MRSMPRCPVIIGSGITGLVLSWALSRAGIRHLLIGDEPNDLPRLGESLNAEGSVELVEFFPELGRFFFPKKSLAVYFGQRIALFDFSTYKVGGVFYSLLGCPPIDHLYHVDRLGFDATLFKLVSNSNLCQFVLDRATSLSYDASSDTINEVQLASGSVVAPSHVFDATNHVRFVAKSIGLECALLGPRQRVVYTHYRAGSASARSVGGLSGEWMDTTHLLRLHPSDERCDGLAWCIPLGSYVSVGISVNAETHPQPAEDILAYVDEAFASRGLPYREVFVEAGPTMTLQNQHFLHKRAAGGNWLLAGPSHSQVWYPSGAGVGTSLAAARLAVDFLRAPEHVASKYHAYMAMSESAHRNLDWLFNADPSSLTDTTMKKHANGLLMSNLKRFVTYATLRGGARSAAFGGLLARLSGNESLAARLCKVIPKPKAEQASVSFVTTE